MEDEVKTNRFEAVVAVVEHFTPNTEIDRNGEPYTKDSEVVAAFANIENAVDWIVEKLELTKHERRTLRKHRTTELLQRYYGQCLGGYDIIICEAPHFKISISPDWDMYENH